ncbi:hypothetical protein BU24DRAFT_424550 [Aaosphaeria arxii CBS 175.79]|uniref:Uncharacterized protein n=1 Tax=Aaosphaeria arxii CBS 175.79 TaxID=1450172 RepID=A0A6A5XKT9_9PLEO|nr:uncharacterized protein BU24DRAFT_424550 [Aaosphaeria arxii CBS 175.79]KAF2013553.1 hypothetical protein BU24DRAFT_424550 [Aaosphaeria arxii CBS 175.79]
MKLSWSFAVSSLFISASAASKAGHVFVYDPASAKAAPLQSSVTPETARWILAQRLGVSQFHSIDDPSEEAIEQLNAYSGRTQTLLGGDNSNERDLSEARVLVWIDDVEDASAIISDSSAYSAQFTVADPPSGADNDRLIRAIATQAESLPKKEDAFGRTYTDGITIEKWLKPLKAVGIHNEYLSTFHAVKKDELSSSELAKALSGLLEESVASGEQGWPITVVLMPPSGPKSKRDVNPYGAFDIPRDTDFRRPKTEEFLSPSSSQPSQPPKAKVSNLEDFPIISAAKPGAPIRGILPSCFSSQDACIQQTNNCSSHGGVDGGCVNRKGKKGTGRVDCWHCQCEPTVEFVGGDGMEERKRTTYWGGPACQKKDISTPFWLFVSTGVIIAFLISSAIGMLYSMGSEELPSVIGAGVSGPQRK